MPRGLRSEQANAIHELAAFPGRQSYAVGHPLADGAARGATEIAEAVGGSSSQRTASHYLYPRGDAEGEERSRPLATKDLRRRRAWDYKTPLGRSKQLEATRETA